MTPRVVFEVRRKLLSTLALPTFDERDTPSDTHGAFGVSESRCNAQCDSRTGEFRP